MTEFEKIALLYVAQQNELLSLLVSQQDVVYRTYAERSRQALAAEIRAVASPDTLKFLGYKA